MRRRTWLAISALLVLVGCSTNCEGVSAPTDVGPGLDDANWAVVTLERPAKSLTIFKWQGHQPIFPETRWEDGCGLGCSSTSLRFGDGIEGMTIGSRYAEHTGRHEAYAMEVHYFENTARSIARAWRLSDGAELGGLLVTPKDGEARRFVVSPRSEDPDVILVQSFDDGNLWLVHSRSGWDLKLPWRPLSLDAELAELCYNFGAPEQPVLAFGCPTGLHVMKTRGNSEVSVLGEKVRVPTGEGSGSSLIWAEHVQKTDNEIASRIRVWSFGGDEVRNLGELPGEVCALAATREHVAGVWSRDGADSRFCLSHMANPEIFRIGRDDGRLELGPRLADGAVRVGSLRTNGRFSALIAEFPTGQATIGSEATRILLLRHSDGKMRQFVAPAGFTLGRSTIAIDEEHLYFTRWSSKPRDHRFDRLFRYRLDSFDEIGEPYEAPGS